MASSGSSSSRNTQQIEGVGLDANAGERLLAISHDLDLVAIALERKGDGERHGAFVFGQKDIQRGKPSALGVHGGDSVIVPIVISTVKRFVA
jgi:hypothetical protein